MPWLLSLLGVNSYRIPYYVTSALVRCLAESSDKVRFEAVKALQQIAMKGDTSPTEALVALLDDPSKHIKVAAALCLGNASLPDNTAVITALERCRDDDTTIPSVRNAAITGLHTISGTLQHLLQAPENI